MQHGREKKNILMAFSGSRHSGSQFTINKLKFHESGKLFKSLDLSVDIRAFIY